MTIRTLSPVLACSALAMAIGACAGAKNDDVVTPLDGGVAGGRVPVVAAVSEAAVDAVLKEGSSRKLLRFASNDALGERLEAIQKRVQSRYAAQAKKSKSSAGVLSPSSPPGASFDSAAPVVEATASEDAGGDDDESITNTQEAGVDEGGIVKAHGDHLVVLRRGRLFTVEVGDDQLRPTSKIDVSPAKGHDAWYDEMLISGNTIVVVGFSYQTGSTELGLFNIDSRGQLSRKDTFFLRSNDYYSSRNYASRLIGDKLIFYMPHYLGAGWNNESPNLPGVANWDAKRQQADDWNAIIDGSKVFQPVQNTDNPVLHSVITCDLGQGRFSCDAQGILGPPGRNFYVSSTAVYVWTHEGWRNDDRHQEHVSPAAVYRLPLDGGRVGALRTWGAPVDQFSFKESRDGYLNVLVRADSKGDAMWSPEFANGDIGMMRVPVAAFDRGVSDVGDSAFVDLPEPQGNGYAFQNRFVGDYLLYGTGGGWGGSPQESRGSIFAHPFSSGQDGAQQISIPHGVDRIEPMGGDAVVIGSDGRNLHFSSMELGAQPGLGGAYVQRGATQGELRSHGFFYKPTSSDRGMLGLPVRHASAPGHAHLTQGSAEILFLDVDRLNFRKLGALASDPRVDQDDKCEVSCVDWYGNARPIFYKGRVFALLGYELVEGAREQGSMQERRRANILHPSASRPVEQAPWKR